MYYKKGAEKAGVKVIPSRLSIVTKRINNERGVCYYCGNCGRSCGVYADFSASSSEKCGVIIEMSLKNIDQQLFVINKIFLEDYLMCVATSEMGAKCPQSLIEAQTIVARSWILAAKEKNHQKTRK